MLMSFETLPYKICQILAPWCVQPQNERGILTGYSFLHAEKSLAFRSLRFAFECYFLIARLLIGIKVSYALVNGTQQQLASWVSVPAKDTGTLCRLIIYVFSTSKSVQSSTSCCAVHSPSCFDTSDFSSGDPRCLEVFQK